ncbi:glycosyltransferase family 2 protein [candidate division KSB1 bacterium]|nr:glycosyltransferase family 2 protein [candidate division KSB1 bacterium]
MQKNIKPGVSIIIPVRNEFRYIHGCLMSILAMEPVDGALEILIIDGMSEDGTRAILEGWRGRHPAIKILDNPQKHVPAALNIGIRHAQGDWIVRMDAHAEYPKNYLKRCLETAIRTQAENVGGRVISRCLDSGIQGKIIQALTTNVFGVGNARFRLGGAAGWTDTVAFGCYRADVFQKIGLFDERLRRNQDYEFNKRLRAAGGRVWFEPSIAVNYYNQTTLKGLGGQALKTGCWNVWTWTIAPYAFSWRHVVPLLFVLSLILDILLIAIARSAACQLLAATAAAYFAVAFLASSTVIVKRRNLLYACLPFLFFIYHLTYGLGELWGIVSLISGKAPVGITLKKAPCRHRNRKIYDPLSHPG